MTTGAQWLAGARPRTLPAAVAPVLVGTGAAQLAGGARLGRALLALVVALALQVGVNYANDYSDGRRGTDTDRVGPVRLVGQRLAAPAAVRRAALLSFAVACAAGLWLALLSSWWLVPLGAGLLAAAWGYTGGRRPYGYRGLGELAVFVCFGLVAVGGTAYVQVGSVPAAAVLGGVGCGALAAAILVTNNLRDRPLDAPAGKRTLAVRLGDRRTRVLYAGLLAVAAAAVLALVPVTGWALLALLALPAAARPLRAVAAGAGGRDLVPVLVGTGRLQLLYGALLALGLALGR